MAISPDDRRTLLMLAREALQAEIAGGPRPARPAEGVLEQMRGCFVTLTNAGRLRGCIGTFHPQAPLAELVPQMAVSAVHDPRFTADPITVAELPDLRVEISLLTVPEKTDYPEQLEIGTHGIWIQAGGRSGCFLPEVATDHNMGVEEFLSTCCTHKAGLAPDASRDPAVDVLLFTSEKFGEPA